MKSAYLNKGILIGLILGIASVGIPYAVLRDVTTFWGSYFYWIVLTLVIMIVVWWKVLRWGETE